MKKPKSFLLIVLFETGHVRQDQTSLTILSLSVSAVALLLIPFRLAFLEDSPQFSESTPEFVYWIFALLDIIMYAVNCYELYIKKTLIEEEIMYRKLIIQMMDPKISQPLRKFSEKNSGKIKLDEIAGFLEDIFREEKIKSSQSQILRVVRDMDRNRDGYIDFTELKIFLEKTCCMEIDDDDVLSEQSFLGEMGNFYFSVYPVLFILFQLVFTLPVS